MLYIESIYMMVRFPFAPPFTVPPFASLHERTSFLCPAALWLVVALQHRSRLPSTILWCSNCLPTFLTDIIIYVYTHALISDLASPKGFFVCHMPCVEQYLTPNCKVFTRLVDVYVKVLLVSVSKELTVVLFWWALSRAKVAFVVFARSCLLIVS